MKNMERCLRLTPFSIRVRILSSTFFLMLAQPQSKRQARESERFPWVLGFFTWRAVVLRGFEGRALHVTEGLSFSSVLHPQRRGRIFFQKKKFGGLMSGLPIQSFKIANFSIKLTQYPTSPLKFNFIFFIFLLI
jgi:hypothetical protein